jgi:hypothetical protein
MLQKQTHNRERGNFNTLKFLNISTTKKAKKI